MFLCIKSDTTDFGPEGWCQSDAAWSDQPEACYPESSERDIGDHEQFLSFVWTHETANGETSHEAQVLYGELLINAV